MPDKTLKSLKFPGLSGTYQIPQLAYDYNPDFSYEYGDYCTYQGQLYVCTYYPIDTDDSWDITGPFNEDYWDLVCYDRWGYADYISSNIAPYDYYYDPSVGYMVGQLIVLQEGFTPPGGAVYRCIKDTPNPAGSFDENYWFPVGYDFIRDLLSQEQLQINTKVQLFDQKSSILDSVLLDYIPSDSPEDDDPFQPWKIVGKDSDTNSFRFAYRIVDLNESFSYLLSIFSNQDHAFSVFYYYGYADTALIEDIDFPITDEEHSWKSLEAYDWSSDDPIKINETNYAGSCFVSRINFSIDNDNSSRLVIAICSQERDEQEDISNITYSDLEDVTSQLILSRMRLEDLSMSYDKNDPRAIQQFLNLADGYLKGSGMYMSNQPTFLQADCRYRYPTDTGHFNFTASTFIQSCLRGFSFNNTPYSANWTWYQPPSSSVPWQYPAEDGLRTITPQDWIPNKWQYSWAINPYDDKRYAWAVDSTDFITETRTLEEVTTQVSPGQMFNECGALARWMVDKGWMVDTGFKLPDMESIGNTYFEYNNMNISCIQPGDILFFAEKCQREDGTVDYISDSLYGDKYNHISHVSIVADVQLRANISLDVFDEYDDSYHVYSIVFYDSPSLALNLVSDANSTFELNKTFLHEINRVEKDGAVYCLPSYETLCLVCRPDLHSSKETYLESEARKLGLHTVPENAMQLEIIRRCRLCSDIEWIPGRDYDRPMPLTTSVTNYSGYGFTTDSTSTSYYYNLTGEAFNQNFDPQYDIMVNGKFKQGTKYKGLPWTAKIPENATSKYPVGFYSNDIMCPEQFVSTISNENALTYIDSQNKVYPIYGWNQPMDFIKFVFDNQSFGGYSIDARFAIGGMGFDRGLLLDEPTTAYPGADGEWRSEFIDEILKLGQIVHSQLSSTHQHKLFTAVGIVTDFIKDENNVVKYIEVTEATRYGLINPNDLDGQYGNLIRRKMFSVPEFCDWFNFTYLNNY